VKLISSELIICNTTPLLYLYQLDLLSILHDICDRIIVPQAVVEELRVGGKQGIEVPNVLLFDWIEIRSPLSNSARPLIQDLGDGETEVLLLALENPGSLVILDDNHARTYAQLNKIPVIGTCGILLKAKSEGYINQLTPILDILERKGFYISKEFKQLVIRLAHE
jgi:predicted nucleic acid-binding protein